MSGHYKNPSRRGVVYFIRRLDGVGPVKIGFTSALSKRLQAMQGYSPELLEIVASVPGGFRDEQRLHRQFARFRLHGEWFEASPEVLAAADRAASLGALPEPPPTDKWERIAELYRGGMLLREIGQQFGISHQRVEQILRMANVPSLGLRARIVREPRTAPVRQAGPGKTMGRRLIPEVAARDEDVARDYAAGLPALEICAKHGVHPPQIYRALRRFGVELRRRAA